MNTAAIHPAADAIDVKGLQSRSLRGWQTIIDARLPEDLKGTLHVLLRHYNDQSGLCCPGQDLIAAKLGVTENTVRARLRKLEQRGLVTVNRTGRWHRYTIHFQAIDALEPAAVPVDNSLDTLNLRTRYPKIAASIPSNHDADTLKIYALTGKGTGYSTEGGTEARAGDAVDNVTFPPLQISEDLKTEQPGNLVDDVLAHIADARAEGLPISGQSLRDLIEAADACGEVPLAVAADAVRGCLPAADAPALAAPAPLATPAEPVIAPIVAPPATVHPTPALAVAIAPDTLAAVNAQRLRHGKAALKPADLQDLHREATLVGIAPQAAAEYILAKPSRTFLLARHYRPDPSAATQPAPIDEAAKAQGRAKIDAVQVALCRGSIDAMFAPVLIGQPLAQPKAPTSTRTVTRYSAGATALGGRVEGLIDPEQVLRDYAAGLLVKTAQVDHALFVTGRSRAELRDQRAAAKAALAEGAAA